MTDLLTIAKRVLETGETNVPKHVFMGALTKLASEIQRPGESDAAAFTRAMTSDVGSVIYKASKFADGPDHVLGSTARLRPELVEKRTHGPHGEAMEALADAHLKAHPELAIHPVSGKRISDGGRARAYDAVFNHPKNRELRDNVKGEEHSAQQAAAAELRGAQYRTMDAAHTSDAQGVAPRKAPWDDTRSGAGRTTERRAASSKTPRRARALR